MWLLCSTYLKCCRYIYTSVHVLVNFKLHFYLLLKIANLQAHGPEYLLNMEMKQGSNYLSCEAQWVSKFSI